MPFPSRSLAASLLHANRLFRQRRVDRRAKKEALCNGLETLEPRLPLDASGGLPSLDFAREVRISSSLVGPDPLLFSKSELVGHGTGGFVVSAVAAGATVEKWDEATDQWRDVSTPPESGNPRELLSLLQNRVVREGDRLRWVPAAGDGAVREAFAIIGWDAAGAAAEPDTTGAPGPVQDLTIDVTDNDIQVSWAPPSGGAAAAHYSIATHWRNEAPGSGHEAVAGVVTLLPASQTTLRVPWVTAPLGDGSSQFLVGVHAHGAEGTSDVTTAQTSLSMYLKLFPGLADGVPFPILDIWGQVPSSYDGPNAYPGAQLSGLDMTMLDLTNADLHGADLSHTFLGDSLLTGANLFNADLSHANFVSYTQTDLTNANLAWANLSGADLDWAYLTNANFMGANLSGARLTLVSLDGALFMGVDLSNTDLDPLGEAKAYYDERTIFPADYDPVAMGWIKYPG